eukprot:TRINITY_DN79_c0_g1_i3.p2 TRINITY_DN79_c0_g1~~TRINITY_DN79_c0_g1_i3.p2  ORF type:complete len:391 (+),score=98.63 TRINITY_DN79_c0_g1_i3:667-1839(+)
MTLSFALALAALAASAAALCPGQNLRINPEDPSQHGAYPIGVREMVIPHPTTRDPNRKLITVIWYPAAVPATVPAVFDIRVKLPDRYNESIPDENNPWNICDDPVCQYGLPLDETRGPYPVKIHVHGTGAWSTASLHNAAHWASRGFVVVACDHPGITLKDMLTYDGSASYIDQKGDVLRLIEALSIWDVPETLFLQGHVNITNLAVSGHSAGGSAVATLGSYARVLIPMASSGVSANDPNTMLESVLVLGGIEDGIVNYRGQQAGYEASPAPKRLAGCEMTGHHFCTEMCYLGRDQGGIAQIAIDHDIPEGALFKFLAEDGCDYYYTGEFLQPETHTWPFTNFATSAAMEEVMMCDERMADKLANIQTYLPWTGEYREQLGVELIKVGK